MKSSRWEISNFLTKQECDALIDFSEQNQFEVAQLNTPSGLGFNLNYRNNDKFTFEDKKLAENLWLKIETDERLNIVPGWKPIGLNERFRIYKYSKNQYFALHLDGSFERIPFVEQSWITLLIYLNENFVGGETSFQDGITIPKTGLASFMTQHNYLHEALEVKTGIKYVLRSDIMFRNL